MATKKSVISTTDYRTLLKDIKKLSEASESRSSKEKISGQWSIGKRIAALKLSEQAGYHNSVIRDLSADTGLAISTLHQSVQFFKAYRRKAPYEEGVSWTHYRSLLRLPKKDRDYYIRKVQDEGWSGRQLESAISRGLHDGKPKKPGALERPALTDYLYRADVLDIIDGDTLDLSVDLGFGVKRELRCRLAAIDTPQLETPKGRKARDFVATKLMRARTVAVLTRKADKYGRFVVHLFYATRNLTALQCFQTGVHLNELIVREKLGIVVG